MAVKVTKGQIYSNTKTISQGVLYILCKKFHNLVTSAQDLTIFALCSSLNHLMILYSDKFGILSSVSWRSVYQLTSL